ncbi:MAG: hypothetical protein WCB58_13255 [Acidobacteriaceae bacterium]
MLERIVLEDRLLKTSLPCLNRYTPQHWTVGPAHIAGIAEPSGMVDHAATGLEENLCRELQDPRTVNGIRMKKSGRKDACAGISIDANIATGIGSIIPIRQKAIR